MIKNFKNTVQSMTAKEIIMAMVNGLEYPVTDIVDMTTYGRIKYDICAGCAATNLICKIGKVDHDELMENNPFETMATLWKNNEEQFKFVGKFETAINCLRIGDFESYNSIAKSINIALIKPRKIKVLESENYLDGLSLFIELAEFQQTKKS